MEHGMSLYSRKVLIQSKAHKVLLEQQKKDRVKYEKFFKDCGIFFREGIVSADSDEQKQDIAKLLLFESSHEKSRVLISLPTYVSRMKPSQRNVYYLCAPR